MIGWRSPTAWRSAVSWRGVPQVYLPSDPLAARLAWAGPALVALAAWTSWCADRVPSASPADLVTYGYRDPASGDALMALLSISEGASADPDGITDGQSITDQADLGICLRWLVPTGTTDRDAEVQFLDRVQLIRKGMIKAAWADNALVMGSAIIHGPIRFEGQDAKTWGDWMEAIVAISFQEVNAS
jgi:hypothetical protein